VPDNARNIEELVARARAADAALAAVREGAQPAGDADPYRVAPGAADETAAGDSVARGPAANGAAPGPRGEDDHLAENPAPGEHGAGYSRS